MSFETHELESEAFLYKPATAVETTRKLIDSDLLEVVYTSRPRVKGRYTYRCFQISTFFLSVSTVILIILLAQQYQRSERECIKKQSIYSPVLDVLSDEYETWRFNGTFRNPSPYKGPPSDEVDRAWAELFDFGAFRITPEQLKVIGGSPIAAQFPPEVGGGYLGFMEVLHQLHCLNLLWQYVYKDYYEARSDPFLDSEPVLMEHINHCADLLRQKIMCDADVGLIPMYWVKRHDHPYPDFNTQHKCRNFKAVLNWARDNQVQMGEGWTGVFPKPDDVVELEMPP